MNDVFKKKYAIEEQNEEIVLPFKKNTLRTTSIF